MVAGSSVPVALPNRPPLVLLSLGLELNSPPLLEKPVCEDEGVGLKVKGFDFASEGSVGMAFVSGEARRALAFGLKMSPNGLEAGLPESCAPVESGAEDIGVNSEA